MPITNNWIRILLTTNQLKEPIINIASEIDHLSDVILPTVRDSSMDDIIEDAVNESPLLSPDQREILRSLLEHYEDTSATCLEDVDQILLSRLKLSPDQI